MIKDSVDSILFKLLYSEMNLFVSLFLFLVSFNFALLLLSPWIIVLEDQQKK